MKAKFQALTADELSQVSGGFHISFLDVITGGLDRVVDAVHNEVTSQITNPSSTENHAWDGVNGAQQGDPSDTGNVTLDGNGTPFPGDGD